MNADHIQLIEDCEAREDRLDDWSRTFVDDMRHQLEAGRALSAKQLAMLEEIWERATARG